MPSPVMPLLRDFWRVLSAERRRAAVLAVGVMLVTGGAELGSLMALKLFLSTVVHATDHRQFVGPSLVFAAAVVAVAVARLATLKLQDGFVLAFASDASAEIFARALNQPYLQHVRRESTELFVALENMQRLVNSALGPLVQSGVNAALATALLACLVVIAPVAALSLLGLLALTYGAVALGVRMRPGKGQHSLQALAARRLTIVHEARSGFRDVVLSHAQGRVAEQFRAAEVRYREQQAGDRFAALGPRHIVEVVVVLAAIALVGWLSRQPDGLAASLPMVGVAALGLQRLIPLVNGTHAGWRLFRANSDVLEETLRLMQRPTLPTPQGAPDPMPFEHTVTLDQVSMRYEDRDTVLSGIDLTIRRGERVAIIGPSGSGKSSLLDILLGLVPPTTGRLLVDGVPLDSPERVWAWQRQIACVAQNVYLRDAPIADVIADDGPVDEGRFERAVRGAGLAGFLASLPSGARTRVGDGGVRLSGGQRQRIAIARALYRQAPVLVLDEATSQLDAETEAGILDTLAALGRTVTVLIVTHRDTALNSCDRVLEVRGGTITPRTLEPCA